MKKVIENTAYFAIAVVVIWLIGKGCSSANKDIGEYVYVEFEHNNGATFIVVHTDKDCDDMNRAEFMKPDELYNAGFYLINYCTECVTDKQYKQLQKYQKQP